MRELVAGAALLLALTLALYPMDLAETITPLGIIGGLGVAAVALALLTSQWVLAGPGVGLIVIEYAIALVLRDGPIDLFSPLYGAGCLLLLELIDLTLVMHRPQSERGVVVGHARHAVSIVAVAILVAVAALLAGALLPGHHLLLIAASACGLGALSVAVAIAHRALAPHPPSA
jgi:hypothetical protein